MLSVIDKLVTVVHQTRLTTLATVDVPWWNLNFRGKYPCFGNTRIPFQHNARGISQW